MDLKRKNGLDVMIDIETLATDTNATVITIAGIRFNALKNYREITSPYEFDHFYCRVDTESQEGRTIADETLQWWASQEEDVRIEAFSPEDRFSLEDALTAFTYWASGADRYWANGIAFDYPILESCCAQTKIQYPWKYWQVMDARSIYKLVPDHYNPKQMHHHALYDCLTQIQRLNDCLQKLKITSFQ